ncbi:MAG: hypothetical protein ACLQBB_14245 [Solirubrobacteraceae bacterium]
MPGKGPFEHIGVEDGEPAGAGAEALDRQQAILLKVLREAQGATVGFTELHDAGIEFPASVVAELELAGVPIERSTPSANGQRVVGVRLDPSWGQPAPEPRSGAWDATQHTLRRARELLAASLAAVRPATEGSASRRWLAPGALAVVALLVVLVLVDPGAGHTGQSGSVQSRKAARSSTLASTTPSSHARSQSSPTSAPAPVPVSQQLATQLEAHGHELLEDGRAAAAVSFLTRAVAATGEHQEDCLQPVGEMCLTYAYALYDLGRALALDGHPRAAVPVLERRLEIENQHAAVATELEQARAQAG